MHKFEIACYYGRPILPAQFSAAQADIADIADKAELDKERFSACFDNTAI